MFQKTPFLAPFSLPFQLHFRHHLIYFFSQCFLLPFFGNVAYISELIDFGSRLVDQKKRQLRLGAFSAVNKLDYQLPRSKLAIIKRAYRKPPVYGFCPSPDLKFVQARWEDKLKLEQLLHYFHATCKAAVAASILHMDEFY